MLTCLCLSAVNAPGPAHTNLISACSVQQKNPHLGSLNHPQATCKQHPLIRGEELSPNGGYKQLL